MLKFINYNFGMNNYLSLKEAAVFLNLPVSKMYTLDRILKPAFEARGSKMRARYYDPVHLEEVKPYIQTLVPKVINRTSPRKYRSRYLTPAESFEAGLAYFWNSHLHGAKIRGIENKLTQAQFRKLVTSVCAYCAKEPSIRVFGKHEIEVNGIDRINNDRDYTTRNSVSCCKLCNRMKSNLTTEEFFAHVYSIVNYQQFQAAQPDS